MLNHRAQRKSWRGIPLWANLTNQPGWDQYFLSLCLLTRASQWEPRNEVETVDKAGVLGFHMSTSVGGRLRCVQVHAVYLAWFYLTISILPAFQSSSNGVTLGTPNKATITILSNDNAFGIIAFNSVRNPSTCIWSSFFIHHSLSLCLQFSTVFAVTILNVNTLLVPKQRKLWAICNKASIFCLCKLFWV